MTTKVSELTLATAVAGDERIPALTSDGRKVAIPASLLGSVAVDVAGVQVDLSDYITAPANATTCRTEIQQAIDDAYALANEVGASVVLNWPGKYPIDGPLNVPDVVCIRGVSASETGVSLVASSTWAGHVFALWPTLGRTEGPIVQHISGIRIDGNSVGLLGNTTANSTSGSDTLTGVASTAGMSVGHLIEGYGIPDRTVILEIGASTVRMSANATKTATGIQVITREAYTTTGTATEASAVLPVSSSAGMKIGMRVWGNNLEADDDLSAATRIRSVDSPTQITLDRPAKASGAMSVIAWVEVDGFLCLESTMALGTYAALALYEPDGYVSGRLYSGVRFDYCQARKLSGTALQVRGGRHQTHAFKCRFDSNWKDGIALSGANDSYMNAGTGSNWRYNYTASACATPRFHGESFTHKKGDGSEIFINSCRGWEVFDSEINGWITVRAKRDTLGVVEPYQIGEVNGCKFIWTQRSNPPDSGVCAFINSDGAVIGVVSGGYMVDVGTGLRPHRIATITNGGQVFSIGQQFSDNIADVHCPFSVVLSNNLDAFHRLTLDAARGISTLGRRGILGYDSVTAAPDGYVLAVGNALALPVLMSPRLRLGRPVGLESSAITYVTMTDGGTGTIGADRYETHFVAASTIPSYTVALPTMAAANDGEERVLLFHRGVTTLSVTGGTLNSADTWPTTIAAGTTRIALRYRHSNTTWYRIG